MDKKTLKLSLKRAIISSLLISLFLTVVLFCRESIMPIFESIKGVEDIFECVLIFLPTLFIIFFVVFFVTTTIKDEVEKDTKTKK